MEARPGDGKSDHGAQHRVGELQHKELVSAREARDYREIVIDHASGIVAKVACAEVAWKHNER